LQAQDPEIPATLETFDLAFGLGFDMGKPTFLGALSFNRTHGLLKSKKLRLGYGIRVLGFGATSLNYTTAPAKLTAQKRIDTLVVNKPLSNV
jgi:hypothetical protein